MHSYTCRYSFTYNNTSIPADTDTDLDIFCCVSLGIRHVHHPTQRIFDAAKERGPTTRVNT